jgi:hypothetical protein
LGGLEVHADPHGVMSQPGSIGVAFHGAPGRGRSLPGSSHTSFVEPWPGAPF